MKQTLTTLTKRYEYFLNISYSGKTLLKTYKLTDVGLWEVRGEDPNCDFGGHHHNPYIGLYRGRLDHVILTVIDHPVFFTWGGGGQIRKVEEIDVAEGIKVAEDAAKILLVVAAKKRKLQGIIESLKKEMAELEEMK